MLKASLGSGKLRFEGSLSFKREQQGPSALLQVETKISIASPRATVVAPVPMPRELARTRVADAAAAAGACAVPESPKHESAAVTVQKVYKSFRTRRRLADCAVLVEQSWWELLDFALLRRSSVSFFDIERQESAVSKWARARTRAAKVRITCQSVTSHQLRIIWCEVGEDCTDGICKSHRIQVGKGLSKDEKAQKLALQHWLEAVSISSNFAGDVLQFLCRLGAM
jgi:hypothetical protein